MTIVARVHTGKDSLRERNVYTAPVEPGGSIDIGRVEAGIVSSISWHDALKSVWSGGPGTQRTVGS